MFVVLFMILSMFVVKSIVIQLNSLGYGSINAGIMAT